MVLVLHTGTKVPFSKYCCFLTVKSVGLVSAVCQGYSEACTCDLQIANANTS
jgi:hypothetical protein